MNVATRPRTLKLMLALVLMGGALILADGTARASASPRAHFACAGAASFTSQHPGRRGVIRTTYAGFTATFVAASPTSTTAMPNGLPFGGTLTLRQGTTAWTMPRPIRPGYAELDQLCVIQFNATTHPTVLIEGYTGGAHCCYEPVLYGYDRTTAQYRKVIDWSPQNYRSNLKFDNNGGYRPQVFNGHVLLRTEDDAFAYTFGCFACTPMPIRLDDLMSGHLVDVTSHYSAPVTREATGLWRATSDQLTIERRTRVDQRTGPFGLLAAWVADECVLSHGTTAWAKLEHLYKEGLLSNAIFYRDTLIKPHGTFPANLRRFLLSHGYCAGQLD